MEIRVAGVDPNAFSGDGAKYLNRIGEITGVSGQFVTVKFPNYPEHEVLFLPSELSMR